MKQNIFSYRTAALFSCIITILMHLLFGIVFWFGRIVMISEETLGIAEHPKPEMDIKWFLLSITTVFIFSFLMFLINFAVLKAEFKRYRLLTIILASIAGTIIITYILIYLQMFILGIDLGEFRNRVILGNMMKDFFLTLIIVFTTQILYLSNKKQQIAYENEKLLAENMKSRYETLKNQVDPHFLFNTLNTLNTMIKLDPDKAQDYVRKMSSVFRYTLQNREETTLEEELKFTKDYCELMQIRYGDSLHFDFDVDPVYNSYLIIPLSIQTLVENAIKHNVISKRQPLEISIYITEVQTSGEKTSSINVLTVSNPLQEKKEAEPGEGIGLANLTERYRLKFQNEPEVTCMDGIFKVDIPLIKPIQQ